MTTPVPNPYFLYPFASASDGGVDTIPINNTGADSGTVNYQNGWTPNYEYPSTNPSSLPVPRPQMNQLFLDITAALQQLQTQGYPLWVAPASGSPLVGGPVSYPIYATVAYDAGSGIQIWESQIGSNTSVPGADANWLLISGNAQGVPPGTVIDFAGVIPPAGYLSCAGSNPTAARSSYPRLYAAITQVQSCTTHGTTTLTVANSQYMYAGMPLEGVGIPTTPTATTIVSITNSTTVVLSAAATNSTTENIRFFNFGNGDGSTTFGLPGMSNTIAMGAYGTAISGNGGVGVGSGSAGGSPGQTGGRTAVTLTNNELPAHVHSGLHPTTGTGAATPGASQSFGTSATANTASQGSGNGFNILPQVTLFNKCIKY